MKSETVTFRTDVLTLTELQEEAEKSNMTISAYLNFIITDYKKLTVKDRRNEQMNRINVTLDKLFEMLDENNYLSRQFQNTERAAYEKQLSENDKQIQELTERNKNLSAKVNKNAEIGMTYKNNYKLCRELLFAIVNYHKVPYEIAQDKFISYRSEWPENEKKKFMEERIKPDYPKHKRTIWS